MEPFTVLLLLLHVMGQSIKNIPENLIAKKLIGEATPEELRETGGPAAQQPELHYPMQTIADLWHNREPARPENGRTGIHSHLDRMRELKIDFQPAGNPSFPADPAGIIPRLPFFSPPAPAT